MSTAVLAGAQLDDWIADSADDYLSKAKEAAQQLVFLRQIVQVASTAAALTFG